ncbi:MAG: hypothetical protein LBS01_09370 [Prevotellaceae bacterium]|jgi:hypothetical protein|nr:hypothetical protein [Prevotellaceae bacterium]
MSLKIEQKLSNREFVETEPRISTDGVILVPMKIKIGKNYKYVWIADEFFGDTYLYGKSVTPNLIVDKKENLLYDY